jgi:hypothetical protein
MLLSLWLVCVPLQIQYHKSIEVELGWKWKEEPTLKRYVAHLLLISKPND